ncbi:DUF5785 family protein [Nostoc sp. UHCC 0302]|uniref:DUF5789 family protein n=1 Tax=Nostoc sp. UHCC 0302 TaxID=3134896 RepID=UPI00311CBE69
MPSKSNNKREHRGPDKGEAYGVAAVTQALAGVDFPATKEEILSTAGTDGEIQWTKDKTVDLTSLLQEIDQDEFENMPELVEAISQKVREKERA